MNKAERFLYNNYLLYTICSIYNNTVSLVSVSYKYIKTNTKAMSIDKSMKFALAYQI